MLHPRRFLMMVSVVALVLAGGVFATPARAGEPEVPPSLEKLENIKKENKIIDAAEGSGLPFDIRENAMREAALSYGARGGLAMRAFEIRAELDARAVYLDKVFNFSELLIPAPSGLLIEPPVVSESENALIINGSGTEAAVSDRIYDIIANARIVTTARSWRNYLERNWGEVKEPPDLLRPENAEEREKWKKWVRQGWKVGIEQANDVFEADLNQLTADYQGMVRYRTLLSQGMVTPPYALQVDRGVTGGGERMRVGDRAVQITGMPELVTGAEKWQPASR